MFVLPLTRREDVLNDIFMYRSALRSLQDMNWIAVVMMVIFFVFFVVMTVRTIMRNNKSVDKWANMPFEDELDNQKEK